MNEVQEFIDAHTKWADDTFPARPATGPLNHLLKEVQETIEAISTNEPRPHVATEFADCFMLLFNGASIYGLTFQEVFEAAKAKMEINKKRKWGKINKDGFVEHID